MNILHVLKMNSVLLLMGGENKQAIIEIEKYQRRSILGELKENDE